MADIPPSEIPSSPTPSPESPAAESVSADAPPAVSSSVSPADPSLQMPPAEDVAFELPPDSIEDPSMASGIDQAAIDELLKQAQFEDIGAAGADVGAFSEAEGAAEGGGPAPNAQPLELTQFQQVMQDAQVSSIDLLRDVELNVKIELGRSRMLVEEVLKLGEGSVVELDKLAGDPVDVFVNDRLVARGEVLVLNDNFCVRVNEIVAGLKEEAV